MIQITHINPCRPFEHMARVSDFQEMLVDALSRGFGLNQRGRCIVDEAVHHAFSKRKDIIMRDIIEEIWTLRNRFGEKDIFDICALFNCMVDDSYIEFNIFCDRDGLAINSLDIDQIKGLYRTTANCHARAFIENMILFSLMF